MKKFTLLFLVPLFLSCHMTKYVHDLESTPYGIDFREGKWLLDEIESPERINRMVTKMAYRAFSKKLSADLVQAKNLDAKISFISTKPNELLLERVKRQSKCDYLILIKCDEIEETLDSIVLGTPDGKRRNIAGAVLEVYDLNTSQLIYYRKVTGEVEVDNDDDSGFSFAKGANGIMIGSLDKILKRL